MTTAQRIKAARYAARLLALVLVWASAIIGVKGAHFANLVQEDALISLAGVVALWVLHVVGLFADTGSLPDNPPASDPNNPPTPPVPPTT